MTKCYHKKSHKWQRGMCAHLAAHSVLINHHVLEISRNIAEFNLSSTRIHAYATDKTIVRSAGIKMGARDSLSRTFMTDFFLFETKM